MINLRQKIKDASLIIVQILCLMNDYNFKNIIMGKFNN